MAQFEHWDFSLHKPTCSKHTLVLSIIEFLLNVLYTVPLYERMGSKNLVKCMDKSMCLYTDCSCLFFDTSLVTYIGFVFVLPCNPLITSVSMLYGKFRNSSYYVGAFLTPSKSYLFLMIFCYIWKLSYSGIVFEILIFSKNWIVSWTAEKQTLNGFCLWART